MSLAQTLGTRRRPVSVGDVVERRKTVRRPEMVDIPQTSSRFMLLTHLRSPPDKTEAPRPQQTSHQTTVGKFRLPTHHNGSLATGLTRQKIASSSDRQLSIVAELFTFAAPFVFRRTRQRRRDRRPAEHVYPNDSTGQSGLQNQPQHDRDRDQCLASFRRDADLPKGDLAVVTLKH